MFSNFVAVIIVFTMFICGKTIYNLVECFKVRNLTATEIISGIAAVVMLVACCYFITIGWELPPVLTF